MFDHSHLLVSCVFGHRFKWVYKAVPGYRNVFVSNKPALRDHVQAQGWNFILVNNLPLSEDYLISSLQSKWVKYLQFLNNQPEYDDVTSITYYDHKFEVKTEHIEWILREFAPDRDLLLRETPKLKMSISDEISDALGQDRYVQSMPETLAFLDDLESSGQITRRARIANTGFIHYRNLPKSRAFTQNVYETCVRLNQPECQIIWAALSQMSPINIQLVPWESLEPLWEEPTGKALRRREKYRWLKLFKR